MGASAIVGAPTAPRGQSSHVCAPCRKGGGQRGTSRKEDILNTVISLRKPPDYSPAQGARFEVHYEKARGFYGKDAEPFEAWLKEGQWSIGDITHGDDDV